MNTSAAAAKVCKPLSRHFGRLAATTVAATALLTTSSCTTIGGSMEPMKTTITQESVVQFLHHFEELAMKEDFSLVANLIDEHAVFRFNDGDFVGRAAIQAAFEKTWRGDPSVKKARFYLTDIVVLSLDVSSASATYTYHWEGAQHGREFRIQGRGTRVLALQDGQLRILHEHLSRMPRAQ